MKKMVLGSTLAALMFGTIAAQAQSPSWVPPADNERCPSKWGAGDERGAANHMKPATVLNALRLVKLGEVIELGHMLNAQMPLGARSFNLLVKQTAAPAGTNQRSGNEEMVIAEMGQVGTQFDGFAHQSHNGVHYNCFKTSEIVTRNGFTKLGIQNVGSLITRGVLIDVAGYKGVDMLGDNYEINARYGRGNPGLGIKAAQFLLATDPMMLGGDTPPVEVNPNPDKLVSLPVHQLALVVHGVHLLENLKLEELASKSVNEFALIMQPLKLQGATGSTVAPIAVH